MSTFMQLAVIFWVILICQSGVYSVSVQEETNHLMNHQQSLNWLSFVKESTAETTHLTTNVNDKCDRALIIEWKISDILSSDLAEFKQSIAEIAAKTLSPNEVIFLKAFPEAVYEEMFLMPCIPLFSNGLEAVNWNLVEETIASTIKQFYLTDLSKFGDAIKPLLNDLYVYSTIKDKETQAILGFMIASITPALPFGEIKLINMIVSSEEENKGLEKLLFSSMFDVVPQTKRIFCFARPTNTSQLSLYHELGFTKDLYPIEDPNHKINSKYLTTLEYLSTSEE